MATVLDHYRMPDGSGTIHDFNVWDATDLSDQHASGQFRIGGSGGTIGAIAYEDTAVADYNSKFRVQGPGGTVALSDSINVDRFETGTLGRWSRTDAEWGIQSTDSYRGAYAAQHDGSGTTGWIMGSTGSGLGHGFGPNGTKIQFYFNWTSGSVNYFQFGYAINSNESVNDHYELEFRSGSVRLERDNGGSDSKLAEDTSFSASANEWYRTEVEWQSDGDHVIDVYDSTGSNVASLGPVTDTNESGPKLGFVSTGEEVTVDNISIIG